MFAIHVQNHSQAVLGPSFSCHLVRRQRSVMTVKRRCLRSSAAGFVVSALLALPLAMAPGMNANAAPAQPGGFLQQLFSIFDPPASATQPHPPANVTSRDSGRASPMYPYAGNSESSPKPENAYRTVCVRLCDGYYWPVSEAAPMSHFRTDRTTCESSCEQPAKLYYQPVGNSDASILVSLDGKPYSSLDHAFAYRTSLTPSCRCKPDPWSASEIQRHAQYAAAAAASLPPNSAAPVEADGAALVAAPAAAASPDGAAAASADPLPAAVSATPTAIVRRKAASSAASSPSRFGPKPIDGLSQRYIPLR